MSKLTYWQGGRNSNKGIGLICYAFTQTVAAFKPENLLLSSLNTACLYQLLGDAFCTLLASF